MISVPGTDKHNWQFKPRLRRQAFGSKSRLWEAHAADQIVQVAGAR
jgi:hypothetical protein